MNHMRNNVSRNKLVSVVLNLKMRTTDPSSTFNEHLWTRFGEEVKVNCNTLNVIMIIFFNYFLWGIKKEFLSERVFKVETQNYLVLVSVV